eukprot:g43256.t1
MLGAALSLDPHCRYILIMRLLGQPWNRNLQWFQGPCRTRERKQPASSTLCSEQRQNAPAQPQQAVL